ncbi:hypothetical protein IV38_GL001752 [Lactobacillus selangorensis]|uniref:DUF72 domain-containing protein n=1 Tax=Lactobacillus selangorensis TaxID=81857 RepID=A0A0R2FQC1_9LACO|nr:DUF72 domain-containing protein [Lactobacillus selangorensis]KRN27913.1 hypothetical protein IV38_GL001752 [Lactobacillus selangorensis]KRN30616.1 hypothetical protein IV40_GL001803 [Lactobacillus selangorensis]
MITIGLVTWTDHPSLDSAGKKPTLTEYAQYFPVVEVDSLYYGIRGPEMEQKWQQQVPNDFQFILKAYQGMTKQADWQAHYVSEAAMFAAYRKAVAPLFDHQQLKAILFQFPNFFPLTQENVQYLRRISVYLKGYPVAVEFRNSSWYEDTYRASTLKFLKELGFIHVIPDEPQTPTNSVPFVPVATNPNLTILRLHGRNAEGWANQGQSWRKTRTLYHYSTSELEHFADVAKQLEQTSKEVCVIFNNNSAHDAAPNAAELAQILGLEWHQEPEQTSLF